MSYRVFISYSTKDLATVEHVRRAIGLPGVEVFIAEYSAEPGQPLAARIETAIRQCNLFVLLWSRHSKESEWVPQEIGIARASERPILPIVLHEGLNLPGFIQDLKYAELWRDREQLLAWLSRHVDGEARAKAQAEQSSRNFWTGASIIGALLLLGSGGDDKSGKSTSWWD